MPIFAGRSWSRASGEKEFSGLDFELREILLLFSYHHDELFLPAADEFEFFPSLFNLFPFEVVVHPTVAELFPRVDFFLPDALSRSTIRLFRAE